MLKKFLVESQRKRSNVSIGLRVCVGGGWMGGQLEGRPRKRRRSCDGCGAEDLHRIGISIVRDSIITGTTSQAVNTDELQRRANHQLQ